MAERRPLTDAELRCAQAFARALDASAYIPESLAAQLGVTPGAVGHWYRGEIVIPLRRAAKVAFLLSVPATEICHEWAEAVAPFLPRGSGLSPAEAALLDSYRNASAADRATIVRVAASLNQFAARPAKAATG